MCSDSLVILGKYVYNDMSGNLTKSDRKAISYSDSVRVTLLLTEHVLNCCMYAECRQHRSDQNKTKKTFQVLKYWILNLAVILETFSYMIQAYS